MKSEKDPPRPAAHPPVREWAPRVVGSHKLITRVLFIFFLSKVPHMSQKRTIVEAVGTAWKKAARVFPHAFHHF